MTASRYHSGFRSAASGAAPPELAVPVEALLSADRTVVQALQGMGGVGKTQLAIEYAHRFADGYDVVWWVNAEQASLIGEQLVPALWALIGVGK